MFIVSVFSFLDTSQKVRVKLANNLLALFDPGAKHRLTWSIGDKVTNILLSTLVQCIEKQLKLLRRLATEH